MSRLTSAFCAALLLLGTALPVRAADEGDLAAIVVRSIDDVIRPGYDSFADAAKVSVTAMDALCAAPSPAAMGQARAAFADLVDAWSRVELIRFGPVRENNRFERIFFWPDRKGIGMRQIQAILTAADRQALDSDDLGHASVAVQGLGAFEFVLHGDGSDALASGTSNGFRCAYGRAVARHIAANAAGIAAEWRDETGYAGLMRRTAGDNPVYRNPAEVLRDLIGAMVQQLEFVRDAKLATPLGETPASARPKVAPFWRSGLTLASLTGNVEGVRALFDGGGFGHALDKDASWISEQLDAELQRARDAWSRIDRPFVAAVRDADGHAALLESRKPLVAAQKILSAGYADAIGVSLGFNALDGD